MSQKEFSRRRKQLLKMLEPGDIVILPAANMKIRNRDVEYRYRPDSDFYYLTGFPEPEAVAVFIPGRKHGEYVLFCRERDSVQEVMAIIDEAEEFSYIVFSLSFASVRIEIEIPLAEALFIPGRHVKYRIPSQV